MPKVVDHDRRRAHIVEATWRLIAGSGFEAATMRDIAREAGFANGALARYFPSKSALMKASFEYVVARTNERIDIEIARTDKQVRGLAALRIFALEIMPVDDEKVLEAAVVIGFWQNALQDGVMRAIYEDNLSEWRGRIATFLADATALGEMDDRLDHEIAIEAVLTLLTGTQITGSLVPSRSNSVALRRLLEHHLDTLRAPVCARER